MMDMKHTFYAANRDEWRAWLESHYSSETEVWLIYYRANSGVSSIPYEDSVEEALCFGWVDNLIQRIDEQCYGRKFTPRQPNSPWSESNRRRVARLVQQGRMTEAGLSKIPFPIPPVDNSPLPPRKIPALSPELQQELQTHPLAWAFFQKLPPSHRRQYSGWVMDAKKEETRQKRLKEVIDKLEQGKTLGLK
jgi:uncharacterized protein YdeI (YjbR/CyaY-like superfamily)